MLRGTKLAQSGTKKLPEYAFLATQIAPVPDFTGTALRAAALWSFVRSAQTVDQTDLGSTRE
jgi:hypothetical protein